MCKQFVMFFVDFQVHESNFEEKIWKPKFDQLLDFAFKHKVMWQHSIETKQIVNI